MAAERHVAVLAALVDFGPSSQRGLAARLHHDPSDIVALLDDLEGRGDAKRESDLEDRQRRRVTITPRGRRTLARAIAAFEAEEAELMAGLSEADRRRLGRLAARILAPDSQS